MSYFFTADIHCTLRWIVHCILCVHTNTKHILFHNIFFVWLPLIDFCGTLIDDNIELEKKMREKRRNEVKQSTSNAFKTVFESIRSADLIVNQSMMRCIKSTRNTCGRASII